MQLLSQSTAAKITSNAVSSKHLPAQVPTAKTTSDAASSKHLPAQERPSLAQPTGVLLEKKDKLALII